MRNIVYLISKIFQVSEKQENKKIKKKVCTHLHGLHHNSCWSRPYFALHFFRLLSEKDFICFSQLKTTIITQSIVFIVLIEVNDCSLRNKIFKLWN